MMQRYSTDLPRERETSTVPAPQLSAMGMNSIRASVLFALLLLDYQRKAGLWAAVRQEKLLQVAFSNENVSMDCKVTYTYKRKNNLVTIRYYRLEPAMGQVTVAEFKEHLKGEENKSKTTHFQHPVSFSDSGVYYCQAEWKTLKRQGTGMYLHIRDTGYSPPPELGDSAENTLRICLIAASVILGVLGLSGSVLLLLWIKADRSKERTVPELREDPRPEETIQMISLGREKNETSSLYESLLPADSNPYDVIVREKQGVTTQEKQGTLAGKHHLVSEGQDVDAIYENLQGKS